MKKIVFTICILCISSVSIAQTVKASLTTKKIKNVLYLKLDDKTLRYGLDSEDINVNQKLSKITSFASKDNSVFIYLKVRNPIIDEISINTKVIENLDRKKFKEALISGLANIKGLTTSGNQLTNTEENGFKQLEELDSIKLKLEFNDIVSKIVTLINETNYNNHSVKIGAIQSKIKTLKQKAKSQLEKDNLKPLNLKNKLEWYKVTKEYEKKIEIITTLENYQTQLQKWFNSSNKNNGFYKLEKRVDDLKRDSIQVFEISITKKKLNYDPKKEILSLNKENNPVIQNNLNFEKFSRFIPEVRAAVVFTDLSFPNFGTTTNENDEQVVSKTDDEKFNKINVGVMINFNYNLGDDEFVPFFQLGVGPSKKYPIFFSGLGVRINDKFMLSVGGAWTWINELSSLEIGDIVSGTTEIESDQAFKFSTDPKLYLSFQIKL